MPTAPYYVGEGKGRKRVPSVTTITGRFKDSGALIRWANREGLEGRSMDEARDKAADTGSLTHDMCFLFMRKEDPYSATMPGLTGEQVLQAHNGFEAFREWWDDSKIELLDGEMHLVSKKHRYGGTPDVRARDSKGRICCVDYKTSNTGPYAEWVIQSAAYCNLFAEHYGDDPQRIHLLKIGKDYGDFHHHSWSKETIDKAFKVFLHERWLYDELKDLGKLV